MLRVAEDGAEPAEKGHQRRPHGSDAIPADRAAMPRPDQRPFQERPREGQRQEGGLVFEKQKENQCG